MKMELVSIIFVGAVLSVITIQGMKDETPQTVQLRPKVTSKLERRKGGDKRQKKGSPDTHETRRKKKQPEAAVLPCVVESQPKRVKIQESTPSDRTVKAVQAVNQNARWVKTKQDDANRKSITTQMRLCAHDMDWNGVGTCLKSLKINQPLEERYGRSILHCACIENKKDIIKRLLKKGIIDVNVQDNEGNSALHIAVESGNADVLGMLVKHPDICLSIKNNYGETPLHIACRIEKETTCRPQRIACLDVLLCAISEKEKLVGRESLQNSIINLGNNEGNSALHIAVIQEADDVIAMLLQCQLIDCNKGNQDGDTSLHFASKFFFEQSESEHNKGYLYCLARLLLDRRVKLEQENNDGLKWHHYPACSAVNGSLHSSRSLSIATDKKGAVVTEIMNIRNQLKGLKEDFERQEVVKTLFDQLNEWD